MSDARNRQSIRAAQPNGSGGPCIGKIGHVRDSALARVCAHDLLEIEDWGFAYPIVVGRQLDGLLFVDESAPSRHLH